MFKFLKQLFKSDTIKNYSTTLTSANEGTNSKKELNPEIDKLIKKLKIGDKISHQEVNLLLSFYFNKKEIKPGVYVFNKDIVNGMVFEIASVNTVLDDNNDVENIFITLKEIVYNIEFIATISGKEFYEVFRDFEFKQPPTKKELNNVN